MPIIEEHKLIFYHIPKTGGNSICDFFDVKMFGHRHPSEYSRILKEGIYSYKTFTVVRDPLVRFISAYKSLHNQYQQFSEGKHESAVQARIEALELNDFKWNINDFIASGRLKTAIESEFSGFQHMLTFLGNVGMGSDGNPTKVYIHGADYVLRTGFLESDLNCMLELEGIKIDKKLPHVNVGVGEVELISAENVERLKLLYSQDYDMLNILYKNKLFAFQRSPATKELLE